MTYSDAGKLSQDWAREGEGCNGACWECLLEAMILLICYVRGEKYICMYQPNQPLTGSDSIRGSSWYVYVLSSGVSIQLDGDNGLSLLNYFSCHTDVGS